MSCHLLPGLNKRTDKEFKLACSGETCREYCHREGYEVAAIFVDEGESAKTIDRPKFKELLSFCRQKRNGVGVVVVNSISRFARDKYSHFAVRTLLSRLNITLRSVSEPIDDSPTGKLVEGILSTIAQFENDDKAVRTKKGMKEAVERGTWPFPTTLGYQKIPQENGRSRVAHDPDSAPLINQAFELFATGRYERGPRSRTPPSSSWAARRPRSSAGRVAQVGDAVGDPVHVLLDRHIMLVSTDGLPGPGHGEQVREAGTSSPR